MITTELLEGLLLELCSRIKDLRDLLSDPGFTKEFPGQGEILRRDVKFEGSLPGVCRDLSWALGAHGLMDDRLRRALLAWRANRNQDIQATFAGQPLTIREVLPPPQRPWPGLSPCDHPMQLGGRDDDLDKLLDTLRDPEGGLVLLYARSGAGKSSLLTAGLKPALQARGVPVVIDRDPTRRNPGLRWLRALGATAPEEPANPADLPEALGRAAGPGPKPVIILDQAEDVWLKPKEQRAALETLWMRWVAANSSRGPLVHFVFAYRAEFHDRFCQLLYAADEVLPPDERVDGPLAHRDLPLPLLAGHRPPDLAQRYFLDAIERPLREGGYPVRFADPHTPATIAAGLATLRAADREAPLTTELQLFLGELYDNALPDAHQIRQIATPDGVKERLEGALAAHVEGAITTAARIGPPPLSHTKAELVAKEQAPLSRTKAELVALLHTFVDPAGRRRPVPVDDPSLQHPTVIRRLTTFQGGECRLLRKDERAKDSGDWVYTLAHDRVAEQIHALYQNETASDADRERLERLRLAESRAVLFERGDTGAADLPTDTVVALRESLPNLPISPTLQTWWAEVQTRARAIAEANLRRQVQYEAPRQGQPLRALSTLLHDHGLDGPALIANLTLRSDFDEERRDQIFGEGPSALSPEERTQLLPPLLRTLAPAVPGQPSEDNLWGALLAAADTLEPPPLRQSVTVDIVRALRTHRGEPPPIVDEDWSPLIHGEFEVGRFPEEATGSSDEQRHRVVLSPYRIAKVAVTFADYWRFQPQRRVDDQDRFGPWPVFSRSWYEARAYAAWRGGRLPTEREWEVACRGGNEAYARGAHWAGGRDALKQWAVVAENREALGFPNRPMDANSTIPGAPDHPLGLRHIQGNMFTWTMDWYEADYSERAQAGPQDPTTFTCPTDRPAPWRVIRGGSWYDPAANARAAGRDWNRPGNRRPHIGLRLVLLPQPAGTGT